LESHIKSQTTINAPIERVWDALVNPDMTARYMFGCRVASDWKTGSRVDWIGIADGKDVTYVTGELIAFEPHNRLIYSVIDPFATYPQTAENHLVVTCELSEEDGVTTLSVSQGDYTKVAEGEKRYGHGPDGWHQLLGTIKGLIERQ
jgi:uncharacterized protein YndB with AHSA1/START domain